MTDEKKDFIMRCVIEHSMNIEKELREKDSLLEDAEKEIMELQQIHAKEIKTDPNKSRLVFFDARECIPEPNKVYLCIVNQESGTIINDNNLRLLIYHTGGEWEYGDGIRLDGEVNSFMRIRLDDFCRAEVINMKK